MVWLVVAVAIIAYRVFVFPSVEFGGYDRDISQFMYWAKTLIVGLFWPIALPIVGLLTLGKAYKNRKDSK